MLVDGGHKKLASQNTKMLREHIGMRITGNLCPLAYRWSRKANGAAQWASVFGKFSQLLGILCGSAKVAHSVLDQ